MIARYAKAVLAVLIVAAVYVTGDPDVVNGLNDTVEALGALLVTAGVVSQVPNDYGANG